MTRTTYRGYTITTPSGIDEHDAAYIVYRIYKAEPLTAVTSEEHFADENAALASAEALIDRLKEA
jgi:hypothetical protein